MKITGLSISIGYMAALFIFSSLPDREESKNILSALPSVFQNLLHIPAYGILAILWIQTLKIHHYQDRIAVMLAVGIAGVYGAVIEFYQAFVPGRSSSFIDLIMNLGGVVLFTLVYYYLNPAIGPSTEGVE